MQFCCKKKHKEARREKGTFESEGGGERAYYPALDSASEKPTIDVLGYLSS
jgi:hypothetical protein